MAAGSDELYHKLGRQEYRCAISGDKLTVDTAAVDHIVAMEQGGDSDIGNLQWISKEVNRCKGTMSTEDFIALCKRVARWNT